MNEPEDIPTKDLNPFAPTSGTEPTGIASPGLSVPLAFGLTALVACSFFLNIGLGMSMLLLTVPAYIRAASSSLKKIASGQELSVHERILTFLSSIAAVLLCFFAGTIGLFATCISLLTVGSASSDFWSDLNMQYVGLVIFLVLCGGAWIGTAGLVYWLMWPRRQNVAKEDTFKKNRMNE